jgi:hypothetical protein
MSDRLPNGVKRRMDGEGDGWAAAHRSLDDAGDINGIKDIGFPMNDVDVMFGFQAFGMNTGDKLFVEYQPDGWPNRSKFIRQFAVVALFDRKFTENAAFSSANRVSTAYHLWICRTFATCQAYPPRFFYSIGGQTPPWVMVELDITTGQRCGRNTIIKTASHAEWIDIWDRLGLVDLRLALRAALRRSETRPGTP